MLMTDRTFRILGIVCLISMILYAGCVTLNRTNPDLSSTPLAWQPSNVIQNIDQLKLREESGSPQDILEFIADQMTGIQPVFQDSLIVEASRPVRIIYGVKLGDQDGDGYRFWPDYRSGAGIGSIHKLVSPEKLGSEAGEAVVLLKDSLTSDRIENLIHNGAKVIISVGQVNRHITASEGVDALILEILPQTLAELSGLTTDSIAIGKLPNGNQILSEPLQIEIQIESHKYSLNAMGFMAGQDPSHASELTIVVADPELILRESNSSNWLSTAILLEIIRRYLTGSAQDAFPKRSILAVAGTGGALSSILKYPIWDQQHIRAVLIIGHSEHNMIQIRGNSIPIYDYPLPDIRESEELEPKIIPVLEDLHLLLKSIETEVTS